MRIFVGTLIAVKAPALGELSRFLNGSHFLEVPFKKSRSKKCRDPS